jgi:hypothetical protein
VIFIKSSGLTRAVSDTLPWSRHFQLANMEVKVNVCPYVAKRVLNGGYSHWSDISWNCFFSFSFFYSVCRFKCEDSRRKFSSFSHLNSWVLHSVAHVSLSSSSTVRNTSPCFTLYYTIRPISKAETCSVNGVLKSEAKTRVAYGGTWTLVIFSCFLVPLSICFHPFFTCVAPVLGFSLIPFVQIFDSIVLFFA